MDFAVNHPGVFPPKFEWRLTECKIYLLVSIGTDTICLVIFRTVNIRTVIKCPVSFPNGSTPSLIHEMPVETSEGSVLRTFVLQKKCALLCSKLFQISENKVTNYFNNVNRFIQNSTNRKHKCFIQKLTNNAVVFQFELEPLELPTAFCCQISLLLRTLIAQMRKCHSADWMSTITWIGS